MCEEEAEDPIGLYPFYRRQSKWLEETVYTVVRGTGVTATDPD